MRFFFGCAAGVFAGCAAAGWWPAACGAVVCSLAAIGFIVNDR